MTVSETAKALRTKIKSNFVKQLQFYQNENLGKGNSSKKVNRHRPITQGLKLNRKEKKVLVKTKRGASCIIRTKKGTYNQAKLEKDEKPSYVLFLKEDKNDVRGSHKALELKDPKGFKKCPTSSKIDRKLPPEIPPLSIKLRKKYLLKEYRLENERLKKGKKLSILKKKNKVKTNNTKDVTERLTAPPKHDKNKKSILRGTQTGWYIKHLKNASIFEDNKEDRIQIRNRIYVSSTN